MHGFRLQTTVSMAMIQTHRGFTLIVPAFWMSRMNPVEKLKKGSLHLSQLKAIPDERKLPTTKKRRTVILGDFTVNVYIIICLQSRQIKR